MAGKVIWIRLSEGKDHRLEMAFDGGPRDGRLLIDGHDVGPADVWDGNEAVVFDKVAEALEEYTALEGET